MSRARSFAVAFFAAYVLSAIATGSAQAGWLVLGSLLVGSTAVASSTITDKVGILAFSSIEIECTTLGVNGGEIIETSKATAKSIEFSGCKVVKPTTCTLEGSTIGTLPVEGAVTLDGLLAAKGKAKPVNANELFATFKLNGSSCAPSGKNTVTGEAALLGSQVQGQSLWQLDSAFIEKAGELKIGSAEASISGSTLSRLANDMPWTFR